MENSNNNQVLAIISFLAGFIIIIIGFSSFGISLIVEIVAGFKIYNRVNDMAIERIKTTKYSTSHQNFHNQYISASSYVNQSDNDQNHSHIQHSPQFENYQSNNPSLINKFCKSCGNKLQYESKYCQYCGERVG